MQVCGIIAEYNPFHNGHLCHLQKSLNLSGADYSIVVMSGNFIQRGLPALFDKWTRAKMAIENGVDIVIELPVCYATSSAEYFAHGSIGILDVKNRVLIGGDSIQDGRIFMFGEHRNLPVYIASLEKLSAYEGRFDEVYASHSSVEVSPDIIPKLIAGAKQILAGEATGEEIDMFGNSVLLYQFEFAGFLCPKR